MHPSVLSGFDFQSQAFQPPNFDCEIRKWNLERYVVDANRSMSISHVMAKKAKRVESTKELQGWDEIARFLGFTCGHRTAMAEIRNAGSLRRTLRLRKS